MLVKVLTVSTESTEKGTCWVRDKAVEEGAHTEGRLG